MGSLVQLSWSAALLRHHNHCKLLSQWLHVSVPTALLTPHLSNVSSILPAFCIQPDSCTAHFLQHHQYQFWGLFVKESKRSISVKKGGGEMFSFYNFICFRSWKSWSGTHGLLLPRIVLMLAFEDLLPWGIVSSPFLRSLDQSCLPLKAAAG